MDGVKPWISSMQYPVWVCPQSKLYSENMFQVPTTGQALCLIDSNSTLNNHGVVPHSCKLPLLSKNKWSSQGKRTLLNSESKYTTKSTSQRKSLRRNELPHLPKAQKTRGIISGTGHLRATHHLLSHTKHRLWKTNCLMGKSHWMRN